MSDDTWNIIDVHTHILPKTDDGSRHMGETRYLLQEAYNQGIRGIIATPHYLYGHNRRTSVQIRELTEKVQKAAWTIGSDLRIYTGQEIMYFEGVINDLESGEALTLGDTNYVLVEFPVNSSYSTIFQAVRRLTNARYLPILAHIERYHCLRTKGSIEELIRIGAYMQMNYTSLTHIRHPVDRLWCRRAVLEGQIHLLGTDMHRLDHRSPETEAAIRWLQKNAGMEYAQRLILKNPQALLAGAVI